MSQLLSRRPEASAELVPSQRLSSDDERTKERKHREYHDSLRVLTWILDQKTEDIVMQNEAKGVVFSVDELQLVREAVFLYFEEELPATHVAAIEQTFLSYPDQEQVA